MEEICHPIKKTNQNAVAAMQSLKKLFLGNKLFLGKVNKTMKKIAKINPHVETHAETFMTYSVIKITEKVGKISEFY